MIGFYTGIEAPKEAMVKVYSFYPNYGFMYYDVPDHKEAKQKEYILFADNEKNCNTCIHLERIKHDKTPHGPLYGKCVNYIFKESQMNPRLHDNNIISFYPGDCMGMECYSTRFKDASIS